MVWQTGRLLQGSAYFTLVEHGAALGAQLEPNSAAGRCACATRMIQTPLAAACSLQSGVHGSRHGGGHADAQCRGLRHHCQSSAAGMARERCLQLWGTAGGGVPAVYAWPGTRSTGGESCCWC